MLGKQDGFHPQLPRKGVTFRKEQETFWRFLSQYCQENTIEGRYELLGYHSMHPCGQPLVKTRVLPKFGIHQRRLVMAKPP